jgi:hypothetical protein
MKIAFFCPRFNERGTTVALYDYAHFNEIILNNESIIITQKDQEVGLWSDRFTRRFQTFFYEKIEEIDPFIAAQNITLLYMLTHGKRDKTAFLPKKCKTIVHCVFRSATPHGDVYACISDYVNKRSNTHFPVVPHIVHLPESDYNLRKELGIPQNAIVFGRHGGIDRFNLQFVHQTIKKVIRKRMDIYFLLLNTAPFLESPHKQVIHLPPICDLEKKVAFINTCEAMLHARKDGETFGLAVGEFSIKNKPVITWKPPEGFAYCLYYLSNSIKSLIPGKQRLPKRLSRAHLDILKEKALTYTNARELYKLLTTFNPTEAQTKNWDAYSKDYNPKTVMALFKKHFIDDVLKKE